MSEKLAEPQGYLDKLLRYGIIAVLVLVPFHAFLTVWLSSFLGHYELLRLWKEFLLCALMIVAFLVYIQDEDLRQWMAGSWVVRIGTLFMLVVAAASLIPLLNHSVTPKAIGYGLIVDTRPVLFMLICIIAVRRNNHIAWARTLVAPALLVAAFGILQFFILPQNFLTHFGYGPKTISASQTIDSSTSDSSSNFARVQSTLRGPNPLGAYLVPVVTLLILGGVHFRSKRRYALAIAAVVLVMILTFSRSAVLGAVVSAGILLGWTVQRASARRLFWWAGGAVLVIIVAGFFTLRRSNITQNIFFHASDASTASESPNELRNHALEGGTMDIVHNPLGRGVGSAGPASFYNLKSRPNLSENYFLQIGQETGIIGAGLFIALCCLIIIRLWGRRQHGLSRAALAALIGLIVVNMVSHAWADDTLAYVSWALLAAGMTVKVTKEAQIKQKTDRETIKIIKPARKPDKKTKKVQKPKKPLQ